jgi:RND superfamily putative drug exporter
MTSIIRFAVGRPRLALAAWIVVIGVLAVIGLPIKERLEPTRLVVPNTSSADWDVLRDGKFGDDTVLVVQGPARELDRQGPHIAEALVERTGAPQVSPWSGGREIATRLRPAPGVALVIADLSRGEHVVDPDRLEAFGKDADAVVRPPLTATATGPAPIAQALNDQAIEESAKAEHLAFPLLLVVLLLVFRSAVAALIPLVIAGGTVLGGAGVLVLLTHVVALDAISDVLLSMIGIALGVDYALLIVTRFREALAEGDERRHAAALAANTAGRTAMFAGFTLLAILLVMLLFAPGKVLVSAAAGAIVGTLMGVVGAMLATPALLVLLGGRISPLPVNPGGGRIERVVGVAIARPRRAALLAVIPLLLGASALANIDTGAPDARGVPKDSPGGKAFATLASAGFGPGLEIVLRRPAGPISDPRTMAAIRRFERQLARLPTVRSVSGPGPLGAAFEAGTERQVASAKRGLRRARRGLARVRAGLGDASDGSAQLAAGGGEAGNGATLLAAGAGQARDGAGRLAAGAEQASSGAEQLTSGLAEAGAGTERLDAGASDLKRGEDAAAAGARRLAKALGTRLVPNLTALAEGLRDGTGGLASLREPAQLAEQKALAALGDLQGMSVGVADPRYRSAVVNVGTALAALTGRDPRSGAPVRAGYDGLDAALAGAVSELQTAATGASRLAAGGRQAARGAARLRDGTTALAAGVGQLQNGLGSLNPGLDALRTGASGAAGGLGRLATGGGQLTGGLSELERRIAELARGLEQLEGGQAQLTDGLRRAERRLRDDPFAGQSTDPPKLLGSGYATLAALDTAGAVRRAAGRYIVDLDQGGGSARIIALTSLKEDDPRAPEIVARAERLTAHFADTAHVDAALGGLAPQVVQFNEVTNARIPLIIGGIALVTFLVLIPVLRSLLLPTIAVGLNLLTVAATFGVMTLVFVGDDPLLGNTGTLDVLSASSAFAIIFALSIDYQVFLLARMREGYVLTQDASQAISFGISHTARIVTGAAMIMFGTFVAFSTTSMASIQQFGVGLATAIAVDATIVRLVLLPAVMKLAGDRVWWLPDRMERKLPELDVEGVGYVRIREELATRSAELW